MPFSQAKTPRPTVSDIRPRMYTFSTLASVTVSPFRKIFLRCYASLTDKKKGGVLALPKQLKNTLLFSVLFRWNIIPPFFPPVKANLKKFFLHSYEAVSNAYGVPHQSKNTLRYSTTSPVSLSITTGFCCLECLIDLMYVLKKIVCELATS